MLHTAPSLLKTPRLNLRFLQSEDALSILTLLKSSQVRLGTTHWPDNLDISYVRRWIKEVRAQKEQDVALVYAVCDHRQRLMGEISLVEIYETTANLTYWLGQSFWGRGYTTEAGEALLAVAMNLGFHKVTALHLATNTASERVLKKLEFDFIEMQERSHRGVMKSFKFHSIDLRTRLSTTDFVLA